MGVLGEKTSQVLLTSTPGQILVADFRQQLDAYILAEPAGLGETNVKLYGLH
jgi:hypothetical protein